MAKQPGKPKDSKTINATIDDDKVEILDAESNGADEVEDVTAPAADERVGYNLRDVPDYATCNDELRARMDEHIAGIDITNIQSIINLGREELQRMAGVAREIAEKYGSDHELLDTLQEAEQSLGNIDIAGLTSKAAGYGQKGVKWVMKNPGTAVATVAGTMLMGPLALGLPGVKAAYDYTQKKVKGGDLAEELRASIQKTDDTVIQIVKALEAIPEAIDDLDSLGNSRLESYREVSIIVGAGLEALRRVDNKIIPALQKKVEDDPYDFEAMEELEKVNMGRDMLDQHITSMLGSRTVSQSTVLTLHSLRRVFITAAGKLGNHLNTSVPQWEVQRMEAGIALFADKVAKTSDEADKRGTEMLKLSAKLNQRTSAIMEQSARKGVYDVNQVIKVLEGQTNDLKKGFQLLGSQREDLAKARLMLSDASTKLSDNVAKMQAESNGRMMLPNPNMGEPDKLAIPDQSKKKPPAGPKL